MDIEEEPEQTIGDDFDSPWKEALEDYFVEFMAFFFEDAHALIDWSKGHEFLDKELQQIMREGELGRSYADKLVKVWLLNGEEQWIIVHVEIQGRPQPHFAERMYIYNYRTYDAHRKPVASFAILTDENENWNPDRFEYEIFGCKQSLTFRTSKLLSYRPQMVALETNKNIFAIVVLANLKTIDTRKKNDERLISMDILLRLVHKNGHTIDTFRKLLRLLTWMMSLPDDYDRRIMDSTRIIEEEYHMRYVSPIERYCTEQGAIAGRVEGRVESILDLLQDNQVFVPDAVVTRVHEITDIGKLKILIKAAAKAKSLEEFESALNSL